jgi:hypothetical protein
MRLNRAAVWAAYLIIGLMLFMPQLEAVFTLVPARFGETSWRFGAVGTVSGMLIQNAFVLLAVGVIAFALGHRKVLRTLAVVALLAGLVTTLISGMFTLDALELRNAVRPEARRAFDFSTIMAVIKMVTIGPTVFLLGVAAWITSRRAPFEKRAGEATASPLLVREMVKQ